MKPTIEQIIQDFPKWHGSEWETPSGVKKLSGITNGLKQLVFHSFGLNEGLCTFPYEKCTPIEKPLVVWTCGGGMDLLRNEDEAFFTFNGVDADYDIPFIKLTESVKQALKKGGIEYEG